MLATFWAVTLFVVAFAIHVGVWRARKPRNSGMALTALFVLCLVPAISALAAGAGGAESARAEVLAPAALLYLAAGAAYVNTYPAIEVDSVSFKIARAARAAGDLGVPIEAIVDAVGRDVVVRPRLANLLDERYAVLVGGRFKLTRKGRALARFYAFVRRVYGLGMGG